MTQDNKHLNGYISEPDDDIGYTADAAADDELAHREMRAARSPENYYPTCRYCGQVKLPLAPYTSQDAANEAATRECDCTEARVYRAEIERKEKRDENIKRLTQQLDSLSEYCENRSVDLNGELYDYLLKAGIAVLDGIIESAQLKFARMRVSVGTNSKANLVIKFTYSDGATVGLAVIKKIKELTAAEIDHYCDDRRDQNQTNKPYNACVACPLRWARQCSACVPIMPQHLVTRMYKAIGDRNINITSEVKINEN